MVEIPSAIEFTGHFALEVDFFSIGTNDLTQYTFAVDRTNPSVASIADACHPTVLRQIQTRGRGGTLERDLDGRLRGAGRGTRSQSPPSGFGRGRIEYVVSFDCCGKGDSARLVYCTGATSGKAGAKDGFRRSGKGFGKESRAPALISILRF